MNIVDRRLNPKGKSLGNRQRFVRRAKAEIREAVREALKQRKISEVEGSEKISIRSKTVREPSFGFSRGDGKRDYVLPGNKEYVPGDAIPKPPSAQGDGRDGSPDGEGHDDFVFTLSKEEFLDIFFEDLELPDLVKTSLKEIQATKPRRAGFATSGTACNINILRTLRNSIGRRIALKRPFLGDLEEVRDELADLEAKDQLSAQEQDRVLRLRVRLEELESRWRRISYIDPIDIRYNRFEQQPQPKVNAVMFCLMDVSGSMGAREKDLAKRFFILLHLFLRRRYERIDVVFIRHTHKAKEVDEQAFFYSQETGGTVVSTALTEMSEIVTARYPVKYWNIYAAQASDGDNFSDDIGRCLELLDSELLAQCQHYAYVEILDEREIQLFQNSANGKELWRSYRTLIDTWPNFAMKRIARPSDIYPVFRELFAKQKRSA